MAVRNLNVGPRDVVKGDTVLTVLRSGVTIPVNSVVEDISVNILGRPQFTFENGLQLGVDNTWTVLVARESLRATYYFRNHESQTTYLYTSGILFDNASVVVDEDGYVHKALFSDE